MAKIFGAFFGVAFGATLALYVGGAVAYCEELVKLREENAFLKEEVIKRLEKN